MAEIRAQRRLAAILAADVVGYLLRGEFDLALSQFERTSVLNPNDAHDRHRIEHLQSQPDARILSLGKRAPMESGVCTVISGTQALLSRLGEVRRTAITTAFLILSRHFGGGSNCVKLAI